jgi:hypothetical protein
MMADVPKRSGFLPVRGRATGAFNWKRDFARGGGKGLGSSNGNCSMTSGDRRDALIDQILGAFDHRKGFKAQEIEFDEPDLFDVSHRILGDDFIVGSFVERHVVRERPFRNDHAGGVSRGVPGQSFEGTGDAHQLFHPRIGLDEIAQFRFLIECLLERDVELITTNGHATTSA